MSETVQLKPRITIQTVIHFDCPDRATFFAEYSRQLRRGEIFLEVAQKIPVGTPVEVRFKFLDCDSSVELSGEIYRHRRRLDRLEAAVQFLNPDALQKLLRLSENELRLDSGDELGLLDSDEESDDEVEAPVESHNADQDTTKLLALTVQDFPETRAPAGKEVEVQEGAEDEELEATKALPTWGAQWLGIPEGAPPAAKPGEPAPQQPQPAGARTSPPPGEPPSAEARARDRFGPSKATLAEVEAMAQDLRDEEEEWFDLSENQVAPLLGDVAPRRKAPPPPPPMEPAPAPAPPPTPAEASNLDESWLRVLEGPAFAFEAPVASSETEGPEAFWAEAEDGPAAPVRPLEPRPAVPPVPISPPSSATPSSEESDVDLDDWDWDFLQPAPRVEAAEATPATGAARLDGPRGTGPAGAESAPQPPEQPVSASINVDTAEPDDDDFEIDFEAVPHRPTGAAGLAIETKTEPNWGGASPAMPETGNAAAAPPADAPAPPTPSTARAAKPLYPPVSQPADLFQDSESSDGEWPPPDQPFDGSVDEAGDAELELDGSSGSRWGGRLGLVAVALLLLGGTAAVVLEPGWFSSLLGGGETDVVDLSGKPVPNGTDRVANTSVPSASSTIPDPLASEKTPFVPALAGESGFPEAAVSGGAAGQPGDATRPQVSGPKPTQAEGLEASRAPGALQTDAITASGTMSSPATSGMPETIDLELDDSGPPPGAASPVATVEPVRAPSGTAASAPPGGAPTPAFSDPPEITGLEAGSPPGPAVMIQDVQVVVEGASLSLRLATQGRVSRVVQSEAQNPPRLIFDVLDADCRAALTPRAVGRFGVGRVRFGLHENKLRIVLDLSGEIPSAEVEINDDAVLVRVTPRG
jgi:hypothetical protein